MHRLNDEYAAKETNVGTHIFATIKECGQIIKDPYAGAVTLDDGAMRALIYWFADGKCPVCFDDINQGETICDDCFEATAAYREMYGDGS